LQKIKQLRPIHWPWRRHARRAGADAAFAKAIARSEFGRFYTDEQQMREVARSLAAKARRSPTPRTQEEKAGPSSDGPPAKCRVRLWHEPSVRERRTELANARARLASAARLRALKEEG
jgi:hypothetical protein